MFKAGNSYEAKLVDAGLGETKSGDAQPFMKFKCTSDGEQHEFYWYGSFKSEKAQSIAIKALVTAGFIGTDVEDLKEGVLMFKDMPIYVELEEDDKQRLRVKWVNGAKKEVKKFAGAAPKLASAFAKAKAELKA